MAELHLRIEKDGSFKVGTCDHCVLQEKGRPERAWDPDGDKELDFKREELIETMKTMGVIVEITEQYVCP